MTRALENIATLGIGVVAIGGISSMLTPVIGVVAIALNVAACFIWGYFTPELRKFIFGANDD